MGHVMCPVTLPLVVAGDGGGCLKLRALAGRSLSVFLSLSIQAVAYLPVEYSSRARNGDPYGKEAECTTNLVSVSCSVLPFCFSDRPPKIFLPRRFYPEGTSHIIPAGKDKILLWFRGLYLHQSRRSAQRRRVWRPSTSRVSRGFLRISRGRWVIPARRLLKLKCF